MEETESLPGYKKTRFGDLVYTEPIRKQQGDRALVLAIIDRARLDFLFDIKFKKDTSKKVREKALKEHRAFQTDAAEFFLGDDYRRWLQLLGLPSRHLPEGITTARLKYQIGRYPIIQGSQL
jgi:hypothetical protein